MKKTALSIAAILATLGHFSVAHAVNEDYVTRIVKSEIELRAVILQYQQLVTDRAINTPPTEFRAMYCKEALTGRLGNLLQVSTSLLNVHYMAFVMTRVSNPAEAADIKPLLQSTVLVARGVTSTAVDSIRLEAQNVACPDQIPPHLTQNAVTALVNASKVLDAASD